MNAIQCLVCGTILVSKMRHDFRSCDCENKAFVDGGDVYCRIGGKWPEKIRVITEKEYHEINYKNIDGKSDVK